MFVYKSYSNTKLAPKRFQKTVADKTKFRMPDKIAVAVAVANGAQLTSLYRVSVPLTPHHRPHSVSYKLAMDDVNRIIQIGEFHGRITVHNDADFASITRGRNCVFSRDKALVTTLNEVMNEGDVSDGANVAARREAIVAMKRAFLMTTEGVSHRNHFKQCESFSASWPVMWYCEIV